MKWEKKGLIYSPTNLNDWRNNSALQPTPIKIENFVRIYAGFRDIRGISRIGYIDVNANNPSEIFRVSKKPVLDIGDDGMFDENGVVPTCIIKRNGDYYLYYAGYSLGNKIRFWVFSGLAISNDGGETFHRVKKTPVTERVEGEELFRVIHSVIYSDNKWKVWYGAGNHFLNGLNKTLPVYDIRYMESDDGLNFPITGNIALSIPPGCHRVGRPYVIYEDSKYSMYYGEGSESIPYKLAFAESYNGISWKKKNINIELSSDGWDSQMMAYPSVIRVHDRYFMFYNGNNYGRDGVGYAELRITENN